MYNKFKSLIFILIGTLAIVVNIVAVIELRRHPSLGLRWSYRSGTIYQIDKNLSENNILKTGNEIVTINGIPYNEIRYTPYQIYLDANNQPREVAEVIVQSENGLQQKVNIHLNPPSFQWFLISIIPIATGIVFFLIGFAVFSYGYNKATQLFFLFCQIICLMLATFSMLELSPRWEVLANLLYEILLLIVGPILFHFHHYFPIKLSYTKRKLFLKLSYISIFLGIFIRIGSDILATLADSQNQLGDFMLNFITDVSLYFVVVQFMFWLFGVLVLLFFAYHRKGTHQQKQYIGIIFIGITVSVLPSICFSFLPDILVGRPIFTYHVTYSFFILIPLVYFFVIFSYNLIGLEQQITRQATLFLLLNILGSGYLLLKLQLRSADNLLIDLLLIIIVLIIFYPLRAFLQRNIERILYGGAYTPPEIIRQAFQTLAQSAEYTPQKLTTVITHIVIDVMQATTASILLPDQTSKLNSITGNAIHLDPNSAIIAYFQKLDKVEPKENLAILSSLPAEQLNQQELKLLSPDKYRLLVPLHDANTILGLIVLGHKRGGGVFDNNDLITLSTISHLSSLILHIINRSQQVSYINEELLRRDTDIRREIASDLHNRVLSRLAVLVGTLENLKYIEQNSLPSEVESLKSYIIEIDDIARRLIEKNYPPEITLGLRGALRALKRQFVTANPNLTIRLKIEANHEVELQEEVTLALFRITEGALHNIIKHANATIATIHVCITDTDLKMEIRDNGCGFTQSTMPNTGHFGLRIMQTMANVIGGECTIHSNLGEGTEITIYAPSPTLKR